MSMRDVAGSGYTVKASELTKTLPPEIQSTYKKHVEDGEWEEVGNILAEHLPASFPPFVQVFTVTSEFSCPEFEEGDVIVLFDETDLYTKEKKPELEVMEEMGITPIYNRWAVYC